MAAPGGGSYFNPDRMPASPRRRRTPVRPTLRRRYNPDVIGSRSPRPVTRQTYWNPDRLPSLAKRQSGPMLTLRERGALFGIEIDPVQWDRAIASLDKFQGKPLKRWAQSTWYRAMKLLDRPLRQAAPRAKEKRKSGALMRSISARPNKLRMGEIAAASNGPRGTRAPHRYLVIKGTMPHSLAANQSKYRAKSGKSPWSVFPDRGGLRPKVGPKSKKVYKPNKVTVPGKRKRNQIGPVMNQRVASGKVIAWNANIRHPGHKGNLFLERTWDKNRSQVVRFAVQQMIKYGDDVTPFTVTGRG